MFYDWKFLEMVHPGSAFMTSMFSCILCMFCLSKEHPHMFFPYQNPSAKAAFHQNIPIVIILIFLLQILCYSYSELPGDVEIYFRFFQKISTSIRRAEDDGCVSHVLDDVVFFRASRQQLAINKGSFWDESALWRVLFKLMMELSLYFFNCNWFVSYSIYFVLQFSRFSDGWLSLQLDDVAKGVATQIQIISPSAQIFKRHIYSSSTLAFNEKYTF